MSDRDPSFFEQDLPDLAVFKGFQDFARKLQCLMNL